MARGVPPAVVRRPISITLLITSALLLPIVLPIAVVAGLAFDLVRALRGTRRLSMTRSVVLIAALIVVDLVAFIGVIAIFVVSAFGPRQARDVRFHRIMARWTSTIVSVVGALVPMEFDMAQIERVPLQNAIVIARHRSLLDAVLPAVILARAGLLARYTLKEDLRWEPNIDLVGHAIPHRFITRAPQNLDVELERIRELGAYIDEHSAGVIFPEGTFFTEKRKRQIVASLERRDPGHADAARSMNYLLPPRPGGTLALLDGAPRADVVILGHVGFEPFGSIPEIFRNTGGRHIVRVCGWRIPRSEVPEGREDRIDWLFDRWVELDRWIDSQHRPDAPVSAAREDG